MAKISRYDLQQKFLALGVGSLPPAAIREAAYLAGHVPAGSTERGLRTIPENQLKYLYRQMWVDADVRATIVDIRAMDEKDGRVKEIHKRTARMATKGALRLVSKPGAKRVRQAWKRFERRLQLDRREKLESDMRGMMMEGNIPMQWVLSPDRKEVIAGVRMPTETIVPKVGQNGTFADPARAYDQWDLANGAVLYTFPLWQLNLVRLTPLNFDDMGCLGRAYLDASRTIWRKLTMTEEDLVIRRRTRAPQRLAHILENASKDELDAYRARVENDQHDITTDFYLNKKGGVQAVEGDANLDQIADVVHLLDSFYAGSPAPKALFGYTEGLSRDILEDLKRDYFDELDAMQDEVSWIYYQGFCLQLLLDGVNPDNFDFDVVFAERKTETPNQAADRALKYKAIGASHETVFETAGIDPHTERERLEEELNSADPYPDPNNIAGEGAAGGTGQRVSITPGNQPKKESATSITND